MDYKDALKNLVVPSSGLCELCKHQRYEPPVHPEWMSCRCKVPQYAVKSAPVPTPQPPQYDWYC